MKPSNRGHFEFHVADRVGWLRAAVLGANDGVISVSSLVVGVAAAGATSGNVLVTGVAGLVAGAMSMAAGEYVSVQSQADAERGDLARETRELAEDPVHELEELTNIYTGRGLDRDLAGKVAAQLMERDALGAHARDELGITDTLRARPVQAALASAASFIVGAAVPVAVVALSPAHLAARIAFGATLATLAVLGGTAAYAGGAPVWRGAVRVVFWGALAMAATSLAGKLFGAAV
jgi:VIT1/CCC1 family predicted Fe2+/Mn2+ transporter